MGKGKESKNKTQNTSSTQNIVEKQIEEPKMDNLDFGNMKLQRQMEREQREAREEENRKRIAADKAKQETKKNNTKKKNKKSASITQQKSKPEVTNISETIPREIETETNENTSGTWKITEQVNIKKQENIDTCDEPVARKNTVILNRNFNCNYSPEVDLPRHNKYGNKEESSQDIDNFEQDNKRPDYNNSNWRKESYDEYNKSNRYDKKFTPNYNNQDSYNKFKNQRFNDRGASRSSYNSYRYENVSNDKEFKDFNYLATKKTPINYGKTSEIYGDLFSASSEYSLAHCVAEDMSMGAGIAKTFRSQFGRVGHLLNQKVQTGGLAVLEEKERFIYYLVTKEISRGKPTLFTLWQSLNTLKKHVQENKVSKLAVPQIGCGLDRLEWRMVKQMLEYIFQDVDINIVVYIWDETMDTAASKKLLRKCAIVHAEIQLIDIKTETGLIYFGSVDGYETEEFKSLSTKYNIGDYKRHKSISEVIKTIDRNEYIYGLIIKNKFEDEIDFMLIEKCIKNLWSILKSDKTVYVGLQAFKDEKDHLLLDKIIALMQYIFLDVEIWICWPDYLSHLCPPIKKSYY